MKESLQKVYNRLFWAKDRQTERKNVDQCSESNPGRSLTVDYRSAGFDYRCEPTFFNVVWRSLVQSFALSSVLTKDTEIVCSIMKRAKKSVISPDKNLWAEASYTKIDMLRNEADVRQPLLKWDLCYCYGNFFTTRCLCWWNRPLMQDGVFLQSILPKCFKF